MSELLILQELALQQSDLWLCVWSYLCVCMCMLYVCLHVGAFFFFPWSSSLLNSSGGKLTTITELQMQCACASGLAVGTDGI